MNKNTDIDSLSTYMHNNTNLPNWGSDFIFAKKQKNEELNK